MRIQFKEELGNRLMSIKTVNVEALKTQCNFKRFNKYQCCIRVGNRRIENYPGFRYINIVNKSVKQRVKKMLNRLKNLVVQFIFSIFAVLNR